MPKPKITLEALAAMIQRNVAHKEDLKKLATKEDLTRLATKRELASQLRASERRIIRQLKALGIKQDVDALKLDMADVLKRLVQLEKRAGVEM